MNDTDQEFQKTVKRAASGQFREFWLQQYIKDNYKKLGIESLEGPFEVGYDFKGTYQGQEVIVEAERRSRDFLFHKHKAYEVDILIVLNDNSVGDVLGMKPDEWRKRLPQRIIVVDTEDFVSYTYPMRKAYAQGKAASELFSIFKIKHALAILWSELEEDIAIEDDLYETALNLTAIEYIRAYDIDLAKFEHEPGWLTRIEALANDLIKSRRDFVSLSVDERAHIEYWLGVLRTEYILLL